MKTDRPCMVRTTEDVRNKLKIVAALSKETMKESLARLVAAEYKKLSGAK
jgi:hypothetical protein